MPHEHCAEFTKTTKIKFKIGEFSKLNRVTVKTLRHYEEIGLLVPSQVDKWTGYRYYDVCQLGRMNTIRDLKELGFTLEEIGELFDEGRTRPSPELIAAKTAECRETLLRLERRMTELERLGKELAKPKKMEKAFIKELPAVVVATIEVASLMPARPFPCAKAEAVAAIISAAAMINFCLMFLFINCSFLCRPKGG